jgi:hypothetical protein
MSTFNAKKFRFTETFTNTNGKTSGSGFIGVILGLIAAAAFIAAMVGWFMEIPEVISVMGKILELAFASAALMGVRKVAPRFGNGKNENRGNGNEEQPYLESSIKG